MKRLAFVLALVLVPASVLAQEHGHDHDQHSAHEHGEHGDHEEGGHHEVHASDVVSPIEFWGAIVNFSLLVFLLVYFGRKPIAGFLSNRRRSVEDGLAEAQRMKAQAEEKYDEYAKRLEQLDREIEEIKAEMVKAGEAERDRIVADAQSKAVRMRRETDFLIEQQMKQLRVDLTREAVEAAVSAAESVLRESTSGSDQQRLAQEYLERLRAESGGAA